MPTPRNPRLPDYDELYRLVVVEGMTFGEIAKKFNVERTVPFNKMKRHALKHGLPWPLAVRPPGTRCGTTRHLDLVDARLVRWEVNDFLADTGMTKVEFSRRVGVAPSTIYDLTNHYETITRALAHKIMKFIETYEKEHER